jgi:hypothetical protein
LTDSLPYLEDIWVSLPFGLGGWNIRFSIGYIVASM